MYICLCVGSKSYLARGWLGQYVRVSASLVSGWNIGLVARFDGSHQHGLIINLLGRL